MAEIFSMPQQQPFYAAGQVPLQQQQPQQQLQQAFATAQTPANGVTSENPKGQSNAQDPLFEALLKQITTGLGALPVSSDHLQEHISKYSAVPGGRAYLEDLVTVSDKENMPTVPTRKHTMPAKGSIRMTWTKLDLDFTAKAKLQKGESSIGTTVDFAGSAEGVFMPSYRKFDEAWFCWDNDGDLDQLCSFKVTYFRNLGIVCVEFYNMIMQPFAELWIHASFSLPPCPVSGYGTLKLTYF